MQQRNRDNGWVVPAPQAGTNVSGREGDGSPEKQGPAAGGTDTAVEQGSGAGGERGSDGGVMVHGGGQVGRAGGPTEASADTGGVLPPRPPVPSSRADV